MNSLKGVRNGLSGVNCQNLRKRGARYAEVLNVHEPVVNWDKSGIKNRRMMRRVSIVEVVEEGALARRAASAL